MKFIKKNITLVLGMAIPVLMILFVAGSIYIPGLFAPVPQFNFLYVSADNSYCYYNGGQQYSVRNTKLVKSSIIPPPDNVKYIPPCNDARLFIQDVVKNESKEISFEEAQKLNIDSGVKSPDGFEVVYGSRGDGFFSSGSDYNSVYLQGHNVSKKLNVQLVGPSNYYDNFRFVGWIK